MIICSFLENFVFLSEVTVPSFIFHLFYFLYILTNSSHTLRTLKCPCKQTGSSNLLTLLLVEEGRGNHSWVCPPVCSPRQFAAGMVWGFLLPSFWETPLPQCSSQLPRCQVLVPIGSLPGLSSSTVSDSFWRERECLEGICSEVTLSSDLTPYLFAWAWISRWNIVFL